MERLKQTGRLLTLGLGAAILAFLAFLPLEFLVIDPLFRVDYPEVVLSWEAIHAKYEYQATVTDVGFNLIFIGIAITLGLCFWRLMIAWREIRADGPVTP